MNFLRKTLLTFVIATTLAISGGAFNSANAMTTEELNKDAEQGLRILTAANPLAADLAKKAKAILIFPSIVKAGLVFGGAYGEGVLKQGDQVSGYYNSGHNRKSVVLKS